ncbi:MAG: PPOX class F420-dependent oxidoreductase [Anaerolineae bacterium]|jgi:PPOX class probable F420-dependent enzyme|nr:PPOX class F420-dependent oxidoreductase [Anaerolineae bacterium]
MGSLVLPEDKKDLLERPIVVTLVTLMPDTQPQANPVWFNWDGEYIWVNSAKGRQKDKNMRARSKVTILSVDPNNPYRYLEVRGEVVDISEDGAIDHINLLSNRYRGQPDYYASMPDRRGKETRVIYKIKPIKFI